MDAARRVEIPAKQDKERFEVWIGAEVLSVRGSASEGWTVMIPDEEAIEQPYRYDELDELLFALINLSVTEVGEA